MVQLEEILTLPQAYQGAAYLLREKKPDASLATLRRLAKMRVLMDDTDDAISEKSLPIVAVNVIQPCVDMAAHELRYAAHSARVDRIIAVLGQTLAETLADGHTQAEAARIIGVTRSHVNHLVMACKRAEK